MPASVICISRSEGAGGPEIGRRVADRAGFRYVDDAIVVEAAVSHGFYPEAVSLAETRRAGREIEVDFHRFERTETLRGLIRDAIVSTADEGNVVIVAHGASYALGDRDSVLRVLVTASTDTRVQRLVAADGKDARAAAHALRESDKSRAAYLKDFYGIRHELPTHYDLVVNTDKVATEAAADAVTRAAGLVV